MSILPSRHTEKARSVRQRRDKNRYILSHLIVKSKYANSDRSGLQHSSGKLVGTYRSEFHFVVFCVCDVPKTVTIRLFASADLL